MCQEDTEGEIKREQTQEQRTEKDSKYELSAKNDRLVWDSEDILYADLDMQCVPASRMELDVCGHYARPDVLRLTVQDA